MADNVTKLKTDEPAVQKLPGREQLMALRRQVAELDEVLAEARGEKGSLIKSADDKDGIHKGAFKTVNKLLNMPPDKLDAFLAHFDHYRAVMGVDEGRTQQLPFADKTAAQ